MIYVISIGIAILIIIAAMMSLSMRVPGFVEVSAVFLIALSLIYLLSTLMILITHPVTVMGDLQKLEGARLTLESGGEQAYQNVSLRAAILEYNTWLGGAKYYSQHPYFQVFWPTEEVLKTEFIE